MKKKTILLLSVLGLVASLHSSSARADDDYNFSWLDPDKKIYVLQNRKYTKAGSPHLYLMGGVGIAEPYRQSFQFQPRLGFWFNEDFGIEAFYTGRFNSANGTFNAMINSGVTTTPLIREIDSQMGVLMNWAPWYAKINVFNSILYFDWYFSLGLGTMSTQIGKNTRENAATPWTAQNLFTVYLGTGQMFHLSERFVARLDLLGHFYSAPIYGGVTGPNEDNVLFSNTSVNLGIGFKL
jgi:outer membrane beta-barrel protein